MPISRRLRICNASSRAPARWPSAHSRKQRDDHRELAMTHLARVQTDFQDHLLDGGDTIESHVIGTERVPLATRLGIYASAYRLRLIEALGSNYPQLAKLLGEEDFATVCTAYVRAHTSERPSIRYYGDRLPAFLEA